MSWPEFSYAHQRKLLEEKQEQCPHQNVRVEGSYKKVKTGHCQDCGGLVDETAPGSNEYELVPMVI